MFITLSLQQILNFNWIEMTTNRLEAFSDGVLAIIITIMVLELDIPEGGELNELKHILPTFITYVLSFIYLSIYWNNHHHLMHAASKVNGKILWANLHLLFWLSLFPFATGYMGENNLDKLPTALYGFILLMASLAWNLLHYTLRKYHPSDHFEKIYSSKFKSFSSSILYAIATILSFLQPIIAVILYVGVAIMWFIPEKKAELKFEE